MHQRITLGGVYTNHSEVFAREVLEIEGGRVAYRDFAISDGEPMSSWRQCSQSTFRSFAVRECTPEEISRLRRNEVSRAELGSRMITLDIKDISDSDLLNEVRRRGLSVK
jgi:hypothetical protein